MKPRVFSSYGQKIDFEFNKSIDVYIDSFPLNNVIESDLKFLIAMEPDVVSKLSGQIIDRQNEFDYILTFDENILKNCKNSVLFEFGTTWIDLEKYIYNEKKFQISTVCGNKIISKNHIFRKKLWYNQMKINTPTDFYMSKYGEIENINNNKILSDFKNPLFDSMFHICIENNSQKYYFSEKLIDCFVTKTIPIYLGCTNIAEYFNENGMFIVNSVDEIINTCNKLTEDDYYKRIKFIEENKNKAMKFINLEKNIINKIKEFLK